MRLAIIGGGPAGSATAIRALQQAEKANKDIEVIIYEGKDFSKEGDRNFNQCVGVLSYPFEDLFEELDVELPESMKQQDIKGYRLRTNTVDITLPSPEDHRTVALRRIELDDYLLGKAKQMGAQVVHGRVNDLDFFPNRVEVSSDARGIIKANAVVGAFGLNEEGAALLDKQGYEMPNQMDTIVTRMPANESLDGFIQAFLLPIPGMEFGAITPKEDHLVANAAGEGITSETLEAFLNHPKVRPLLSQKENLPFYKGRFPTTQANNLYGNRYVTVGDASGLLRAFKGKGINSAIKQGILAADTVVNHGVTSKDFKENYLRKLQGIRDDFKYGALTRSLVNLGVKTGLLDRALKRYETHPVLRDALYGAVSGDKLYRDIYLDTASGILRS